MRVVLKVGGKMEKVQRHIAQETSYLTSLWEARVVCTHSSSIGMPEAMQLDGSISLEPASKISLPLCQWLPRSQLPWTLQGCLSQFPNPVRASSSLNSKLGKIRSQTRNQVHLREHTVHVFPSCNHLCALNTLTAADSLSISVLPIYPNSY